MEERPVGMRCDFVLQPVERDVEPVVDRVPAAELHLAELRVLEVVPVDVRAGIVLVSPFDQRDVVFRFLVAAVGRVSRFGRAH